MYYIKKYPGWGLFLIVLIFFLTRVIYLDRDLPPYDKTLFGSKDEQAYNFTSINLYHFGKITKEVEQDYFIRGSIRTILNNSITYISLWWFGNNYYGLRGGAVFASLIILMLFIKLIFPQLHSMEKTIVRWGIVFLTLMFFFDFGFLVAGRNAAPVIFRSMYLMLVIFYLAYAFSLTRKVKYLHFFLIGALSSFLIFFSYLTNAFVFAGVILAFIFIWLQDYDLRKTLFYLLAASAGFVIGIAISNIINEHYFNSGLYSSITGTLDIYGSRLSTSLTTEDSISLVTFIKSGILKTLSFFSSNLFSLNYILLFITLASSFITILFLLKKVHLKNIHIISFSFIVAYTIQGFFYNPHSSKWIIVIYPVLLLFITSSLRSVITHKTLLLDYCIKRKRIFQVLAACILLFIVMLFAFNIKYTQYFIDLEFAILLSYSLLLSFFFTFLIIKNIRSLGTKLKPIIPILILFSFIPNIYLSMKYCLLPPQFHYRDALISLNDVVKDKVVAGSWSDGFRLYTQGNTIFPWYQNQHNLQEYRRGLSEIFELGIADYTVDYAEREFIDVFEDIDTVGKGFKLEVDTTLYLGTGSYRDSLIVVKRIPKYQDR